MHRQPHSRGPAPRGPRDFIASVALPALLALAACGDQKVVAVGGGPFDTTTDTGNPSETKDPQGSGREIIVLHDTSTPLQVRVTENQLLRVKVVDYASSGPAVDAGVRFSIIAGADSGNGALSSLQAYTDASGSASVTFRSNTSANVSYTVEVATEGAEPVRFDLFVADAPRGTLTVHLAYEGPDIDVKSVHVRLVSGQFTCGQFNPVTPPTDVVQETTVLGVGNLVTWPNLPEAQRFTVFATADTTAHPLAAAGCLDGIVLVANQANDVTLSLSVLQLNPTGVYDSDSIFDFTGAIPGQVGAIVQELSTLFTSPGTFLIDMVKKLAAAYVGELITNAVFGLFEDEVAEVIDDWMFNESPSWVRDILTVGQDLFQIVNRLELLATLKISKLTNNYYVQGVLDWDGVVLMWRYGCPHEGDPGYDPNCGRNEFSLAQFSNTAFPMDIVEGRFTASILDFDQLSIDNHTIKINYGKLIIFALNELILPALTGEHDLTDAVLSFIDCAAIADGIYFSGLATIGVDEEDIAGWCTSGVSLITNPVELILSGLAIDSQMRMTGHAVLQDDDADLRVDAITDGTFLGNFESDGQVGSPFTGTWHAEKHTSP